MRGLSSAAELLSNVLSLTLVFRAAALHEKYAEVYKELKKRGIKPFKLSEEKFIIKCMENTNTRHILLFKLRDYDPVEAVGLYFNAIKIVDDTEAMKYVYEYFNGEEGDCEE